MFNLLESTDDIESNINRKAWVEPNNTPPQYQHAEIRWLYEYGLDMPEEKIEQILALPRLSLIDDLKKVIDDSMARYEHFSSIEWAEESHNFLQHALWLLADLKAAEALPHVIHLLRQDKEWTEYWFNDWLTGSHSMAFYHITGDDLSPWANYMKERHVDWYSRCVGGNVICILGYHNPERKAQCLEWFEEVGAYYLEHNDDPNLFDDYYFVDSFLGNWASIGGTDLPIFKQFYEADMLVEAQETWEKTNKEIQKYWGKMFFETIFDRKQHYQDYSKVIQRNKEDHLKWSKMREEQLAKEKKEAERRQVIAERERKLKEFPKVGRNDLCPCGSGKKYKKCHGV
jgi:SEC-C motif/Protein of unknown function (DUF1186)